MTDMSQFRELFLGEAEDLLSKMERGLVTLEQNPKDAEVMREFFRYAHTLKGNAATMDFQRITELAHGVEDRLEPISHGGTASHDVISALLACLDALRVLLREIKENTTLNVDIAGCLAKLDKAIGEGGGGTPAASPEAPTPAAPAPAAPTAAPVAAEPAPKAEAPAPSAAPAQPAPAAAPQSSSASSSAPTGGSTVRVALRQLDDIMNLVEELAIAKSRLVLHTEDMRGGVRDEITILERLVTQLQQKALETRMVPVSEIFGRYHRVVRDTSQMLEKSVNFRIEDQGIAVDRMLLDKINEPLVHLLRNAIDHGLETTEQRKASGKPPEGSLLLRARGQQGYAVIDIIDDGRGMDSEVLKAKALKQGLITADQAATMPESEAFRLVCMPGFSTAEKVTELSGRGVGMDVVQRVIESVNGRLEIGSMRGVGTRFSLYLPLNLAILRALLVRVNEGTFVIPLPDVIELVSFDEHQLRQIDNQRMFTLRGEIVPIVDVRPTLGLPPGVPAGGYGVLINSESGKVALHVDELVGRQEVVVKNFTGFLRQAKGVSSCTILGDGRVVLILDTRGLSLS